LNQFVPIQHPPYRRHLRDCTIKNRKCYVTESVFVFNARAT
jgi:hypothetical protein